MQEDTYYPFGMGIMAMSSKAANGLQNAYKYNGIAEEDNFDLDLYAAYYRTLDPQLGRWWQIDPKAIKYSSLSGYHSNFNNPVNFFDPWGDDPGWLIKLTQNLFGGGRLPVVTITANGPGSSDLLGRYIVNDLGKMTNLALGFWGGNELNPLQGQVPIQIPQPLNPDNALFTHYETPDVKARQAFVDYYKDVDFEHGQLMPARGSFWDAVLGYRKALNGLYVDANGYPLPQMRQWSYAAIQQQADYDIALFSIIAAPGKLFGGFEMVNGGEKSIVIGEGMYRVKPAARSVGAKWYQAWNKNFPKGRLMTEIELNAAKARNARWLNSKIKQGYKIYDIGPKGTNITSPFYQLERDIIQKYGYPITPLFGF